MSEELKQVHVKQSQYCLQIVKYKNIEYCLPFWSGLQLIKKKHIFTTTDSCYLNSRRLKWTQNYAGGANYLSHCQNLTMKYALAPAFLRRKYLKRVPYDYANPAVEENVIKRRTCANCQFYFGAINSKEAHHKLCNSRLKSIATKVQEKQATDV